MNVNNRPQLSFLALSNRVYSLEWREGLDRGRWIPLRNIPAVPSDQVVSLEDVLPLAEERYYRLITPPDPNPSGGR